jgi:hypothetical protein
VRWPTTHVQRGRARYHRSGGGSPTAPPRPQPTAPDRQKRRRSPMTRRSCRRAVPYQTHLAPLRRGGPHASDHRFFSHHRQAVAAVKSNVISEMDVVASESLRPATANPSIEGRPALRIPPLSIGPQPTTEGDRMAPHYKLETTRRSARGAAVARDRSLTGVRGTRSRWGVGHCAFVCDRDDNAVQPPVAGC